MKVLMMICDPFGSGGEEAFIMNTIRHIDMSDLRIDLFAPYGADNKYYCDIIRKKGGTVYYEDFPPYMSKLKLEIIKPLLKIIRNEKYDCIHINSSNLVKLMIASLTAKIAGLRKVLIHVHGTGISTPKYRLIKAITNIVFLFLNPIYCACSFEAGKWNYFRRIVRNRLIIVNNGIDLELFKIDNTVRHLFREKLSYEEKDIVIGHVGRLSPEKNHKFIIEIFASLKEKSNNYKLILVGDGEEKQQIKTLANQLGVLNDICFVGNVTNVQDYMQTMDVFVFPSLFEGFGIAGIEAQACGLPVVASTGVPLEMKLTDYVELISIEDKNKWIETIEKMSMLGKKNNTDLIRRAGYDINETAQFLRNIYCG